MAPPLKFEIESNDSNSVYNHLTQWTQLIQNQKDDSSLTRTVLIEKMDEVYKLKQQRKKNC